MSRGGAQISSRSRLPTWRITKAARLRSGSRPSSHAIPWGCWRASPTRHASNQSSIPARPRKSAPSPPVSSTGSECFESAFAS